MSSVPAAGIIDRLESWVNDTVHEGGFAMQWLRWRWFGGAGVLMRAGWAVTMAVLLTGCSAVEFDTGGRELADLPPAAVVAGQGEDGALVVWGGRIVAVRNRAERTELTVLAYPMTGGHRPRSNAESGIRFVAIYPGFLEPQQYAPGRWVSLLGRVDGTVRIPVGEYALVGPALRVEQIHLWQGVPGRTTRPRIGFSIGGGFDV